MHFIYKYSKIITAFQQRHLHFLQHKKTLEINMFRGNVFRRGDDYNDRGPWIRNPFPPDNVRMFPHPLLMKPPPPPPVIVTCGELRMKHQGKIVEMTGRLTKKRMGRFAELRDRAGVTQLVISEEKCPQIVRRFAKMPTDSIIRIVGHVRRRPGTSANESMPTGDIEVEVIDILTCDVPVLRNINQKRQFSTMSQAKPSAITSTEYKMAKNENILKYFDNRDLTCNDLRLSDVGKDVVLVGWIATLTDTKFRQLKDGYGQTQIIVENQNFAEILKTITLNSIVLVKGCVVARPVGTVNSKYETGEIEVYVNELRVLDPNEPYDGPVREKIPRMSVEPVENTRSTSSAAEISIQEVPPTATSVDTNKFTTRTHNCSELNIAHVGARVVVCGWLQYNRMNKFIVLRDGYGEVQVLLPYDSSASSQLNDTALESIIEVEGTVKPRPDDMKNAKMKTGDIEVQAEKIRVLNPANKKLPMAVRDFNRAKETLRQEYRYIDLRFKDMQRNLRIRSDVLMKMRECLIKKFGFVEVETPTLFRRTPGGAQEFIVPTRKAGHFYSLVQSPQQFKQMLMAGAIDRYFQVARCYRDEATRPDRQPEFTQLDIELSFTTHEEVRRLVEEVLAYSWPQDLGTVSIPFPTITFEEAMATYGTDKPDTRFELKLKSVSNILQKNEALTEGVTDFGAYVITVRKPNAILSSSTKKKLEEMAKEFNCKLAISKVNKPTIEEWASAGLGKLLTNEVASSLGAALSLESNDLIFLAYGSKRDAQLLLGRIRLAFVESLETSNHIPKRKHNHLDFLWVIDFPLFEENKETKTLESTHHPFTAPHPEDKEKLHKKEDLVNIRSQAYDLVLHGEEIAGGSIRIHNKDEQMLVLDEILKIDHSHLDHMLEALHSGCPPHGGIALGIDRLIAIICNTNSIRDVMAFPKGVDGKDHLSKAPVPITEQEKLLYHLETKTS